jgi:integrase
MASITPHGDGYRAFVSKKGPDGKTISRSKVWPKKREAELWAADLERDIRNGRYSVSNNTFGEAVEKYRTEVSPDKSAVWEGRRLNAFLAHFGADTRLGDITKASIGQWRNKRLKTVSGSTVVREAGLLRNLFNKAVDEWEWIEANPFKGVELPPENPARHQRWGWQNIRRILRHCQYGGPKTQEVGKAFHIALRTGMRLSEAVSAPDYLDAPRAVVNLPRSKTSKGREPVPLTPQGLRLLVNQEPFTINPNEASTMFSALRKEVLIKGLTFRDARATALTLLARRVDVMTLARISRHRDLNMLLNTYYRESAEEVAARLAVTLGGSASRGSSGPGSSASRPRGRSGAALPLG